MFQIPPEVRATWPPPNFVNPVTRGPALLIVVITSLVFATAIAILRAHTRMRVTRSFGSDDVLILVAMIPTIGLAIVVILANVLFGWNRHVWDLKASEFVPGEKASFAAIILYAAASGFTKLSLLAFYRRLLPAKGKKGARTYKWLIWGFIIFNVITTVAFTIDIILVCTPIKAFWNFAPPTFQPTFPFSCRDHGEVVFRSSLINTVIDFNVLLIPIPLVWRLDIPKRQRILVIVLFSLGLLVVAAGAIKTFFIKKAMIDSFDEQWDAFPLWIVTTVEIDLGIICASAPALRPFISSYFPRLLDQTLRRVSRASFKRPVKKNMISRPIEGTFVRDGKQPGNARDSHSTASVRSAETNFSMDSVALAKQIAAFEPLPEIPRTSQLEWETLSKLFKEIPDPPDGESSPPESIQSRVRQVASRFSTAFRFSFSRSSSSAPSGTETPRKSNTETIQVMMANEPPLPTRRPTLQSKFSTSRSKVYQNVNQSASSTEQPGSQPKVQDPATRAMLANSISLLADMSATAVSPKQPQPGPLEIPANVQTRPGPSATSPEFIKAGAREIRPLSPLQASVTVAAPLKPKDPKARTIAPPRPPRPELSQSPLYDEPEPIQSPTTTASSRTFSPPIASPTPATALPVTQTTRVALSSRPQLVSVHRSQASLSTSKDSVRSVHPSITQSNAKNFSRPTFTTLGNSTMASRQGSFARTPSSQDQPQSQLPSGSPPQSELRLLPYESRIDFGTPPPAAEIAVKAPAPILASLPAPAPTVNPPPTAVASAQSERPRSRGGSSSQSRGLSREISRPSTNLYSVRSVSSFDFRPDPIPVDLLPGPLEVRRPNSMSPTIDTELGIPSGYSSIYIDDDNNGGSISVTSRYSTASSMVADAGWDRSAAIANMQDELRELMEMQARRDIEAQAVPETEVEPERQRDEEADLATTRLRAIERELMSSSTSRQVQPNQQTSQTQGQDQRLSVWPGPGAPMQVNNPRIEDGRAF